MVAFATLLGGVLLLAGCGGNDPSSTAATAGGATVSRSTAAHAGGSGPLAFARCMRANGVPDFPDPTSRGRFAVPAGSNPAAPAFQAAQAKCGKLAGGLPGSGPPPSTQTMAKLRKIAVCMRAHGISDFPDPRTTVPPNALASGYAEITDFDGAILLFPVTLNMQAPAYRQALAACGAPPLGLPH